MPTAGIAIVFGKKSFHNIPHDLECVDKVWSVYDRTSSGGDVSFTIYQPKTTHLTPIVVSVPHAGQNFPIGDQHLYHPELLHRRFDTDWLVDRLYGFCENLGITLMVADYSRYVVDLNRDPQGGQLYADGRRETSVVSDHTFEGHPVYQRFIPDQDFVNKQIKTYYEPYHFKLHEILGNLQAQFKHVLLWDAHSIARKVSTIQNGQPFPDLILGDQDGRTAHPQLIETALNSLRGHGFELTHNTPFKGGYITRSVGNPHHRIHALQLEMSQDIYLNDDELDIDPAKLQRLQPILKNTLKNLGDCLKDLP